MKAERLREKNICLGRLCLLSISSLTAHTARHTARSSGRSRDLRAPDGREREGGERERGGPARGRPWRRLARVLHVRAQTGRLPQPRAERLTHTPRIIGLRPGDLAHRAGSRRVSDRVTSRKRAKIERGVSSRFTLVSQQQTKSKEASSGSVSRFCGGHYPFSEEEILEEYKQAANGPELLHLAQNSCLLSHSNALESLNITC